MRRVRDISRFRSRVKRDDIKDCLKNVLGMYFGSPPNSLIIGDVIPSISNIGLSDITDVQAGTPSALSLATYPSFTMTAVAKCKITYDGNGNDALTTLISGGTPSISSGTSPTYACDGSLTTYAYLNTYHDEWWKYDFGSGVTKKFGLVSIYVGGNSAYCSKNIIFQGSNDDSSWDDLGSFVLTNTVGYWYTFGVQSGNYRYYRLYILDNWLGSQFISLHEVRFYPGTGDSDWYAVGATVTVRDNCFIKTGSTFSKWNTAADGSGTDYSPAATFAISAPTTLYAIWV